MKEYWCHSCNVCCTSPDLLLQHMNGKKHNAKVVKLAQAARDAKEEARDEASKMQQQQQQQQAQISGKKRKAESSKPAMIGIQNGQYWCFPCSVTAKVFEVLQVHLDGKKHAGKLRLLGGPEVFQPPMPLPALPEKPGDDSPDAAKEQKKPKLEIGAKEDSIPPPPVIKPAADAAPSVAAPPKAPIRSAAAPTAMTGIKDNLYFCFPCNVSCNRSDWSPFV